MNVQIFGTKKSFDSKKAERYFKERGIKYQFVDMKEKGSDVNPSTLALTFRILLFGKCFQDALVNGLRIEELKVVLYNQYELIKN